LNSDPPFKLGLVRWIECPTMHFLCHSNFTISFRLNSGIIHQTRSILISCAWFITDNRQNQCYSIIYKSIMLRMIWRKSWITTPLLCNSIIWILLIRPLWFCHRSLIVATKYLLYLHKIIIFSTIYGKMGFISLFQTVSIT